MPPTKPPASRGRRAAAPAARDRARTRSSSPAPGKRRRELRENVRGRARDVFRASILEAADRVFARVGYLESKVADIAREAGMASGTLYNYFEGGKEEIFQTLCASRGAQALETARAIMAAEPDPIRRISSYVRWAFEHIDANAATFSIYAQLGAMAEWQIKQVGGDDARQNYAAHLELLEKAVRDAQDTGHLRSDVRARDLVSSLAGTMNGMIHDWLQTATRPALTAKTPLLLELFFHGATSDGGPRR